MHFLKNTQPLSSRLQILVDSLPLKPGMRVLEIGCGSGAAAREICKRMSRGYLLAIDRSLKAINQAKKLSNVEIANGILEFKHIAIEDFELEKGAKKFDLAFAIRVGALDGRHPEIGAKAFPKIVKALKPNGRFFIDYSDTLKEINLDHLRK